MILAVLMTSVGLLAVACAGGGRDVGARGSANSKPDPTPSVESTTEPPRVRETLALAPTAEGERPPQFVVVSFDGAGGRPLWAYWREVAERSGASFTFFLIYLLEPSTRDLYEPPRNPVGASAIGFIGATDDEPPWSEVDALLHNLDEAWFEGHEIASHFNGHFCGASSSAVGAWSTADWLLEIAEFDDFLTNYVTNNDMPADTIRLPFGPADIKGARTPCLEGQPSQLYPAELAAGYRYDASRTGEQFDWPDRVEGGLWNMPVAAIPVSGRNYRTLMLDYNFYANQSGGERGDPARYPEWRAQTLQSWQDAFDAAYTGNRAPVIVGNHFNEWNGGIYKDALTDFVLANCGRPETYCISHVELADWLDAQSPESLDAFQAGAFTRVDVDGVPVPTTTTSAPAASP